MFISPRPHPSSRARHTPLLALVLVGAITASASAHASDPVTSLPEGPKDLLLKLATDPAVLADIVGTTRSSDDWVAHLSGMDTAMTEDEASILADYLALNVPFETSGADATEIVQSLPADGRELFAANCFSCHGVVSYYLLQDRDTDGWMEIFNAPYHRRLLTEGAERETFSSYAAHAMPIPADRIPEAWME